jgi:hypothetical protein
VQAPCSRSEAVSTRGTIDPFAYHKPLLAGRSEPYAAKGYDAWAKRLLATPVARAKAGRGRGVACEES